MPRHTKIHSSYSTWRNILEHTAIGSEDLLLTTYPRSSTPNEDSESDSIYYCEWNELHMAIDTLNFLAETKV